jgi:hypothetical protein
MRSECARARAPLVPPSHTDYCAQRLCDAGEMRAALDDRLSTARVDAEAIDALADPRAHLTIRFTITDRITVPLHLRYAHARHTESTHATACLPLPTVAIDDAPAVACEEAFTGSMCALVPVGHAQDAALVSALTAVVALAAALMIACASLRFTTANGTLRPASPPCHVEPRSSGSRGR